MIGEGKLALRFGGGVQLLIPGSRVGIGRGHGNQVAFDDAEISRNHAVVTVDAHGVAEIADLGSTNGVLVDGVRIPGKHTLKLGHKIQIGNRWILVTRATREDLETRRDRTRTLDGSLRLTAPTSTEHGVTVADAMLQGCETLMARGDWARALVAAEDASAALERSAA